jgi:hypothetical protein
MKASATFAARKRDILQRLQARIDKAFYVVYHRAQTDEGFAKAALWRGASRKGNTLRWGLS